MKFVRLIGYYILGVFGIGIISCVPSLFYGGLNGNGAAFLQQMYMLIAELTQPREWMMNANSQIMNPKVEMVPIFELLPERYAYSMTIFLAALALSLLAGFLLALVAMLLPSRFKDYIHKWSNVIQSFPDVMFIILLQLLIVFIFQRFGFILMEFAYLGEERIYLGPIITLSLLPTVMFFKIILLLLEDEWSKEYVYLARSKGVRDSVILVRHCIRNIHKSLFYQSKTIVWITLSSLFIIEHFFNFYGILKTVTTDSRPIIIFFSLVMIFTPFYFLYTAFDLWGITADETVNRVQKLFQKQPTFQKRQGRTPSYTRFPKEMMMRLWKRLPFVLGLVYIVGFLLVSIGFSAVQEKPITNVKFHENEEGKVISAPPHDPPEPFILGSDAFGFSILDQLIAGAKYTILFVIIIAFLRVIVGYLLSIPFLFYMNNSLQNVVSKISDGIQYLPLSLIAYLLLRGPLVRPQSGFESSLLERIVFEGMLLTIVVIPIMVNVIGNEAKHMLNHEYIYQAITMGASKTHIFFRHITPHLLPRLIYQTSQQIIQVIYILVHLGVYELLLGGVIPQANNPNIPITFEWAGLISLQREAIMTGKYLMVLPALVLLLLFLFSIHGVFGSIQEEIQRNIGLKGVSSKKKKGGKQSDTVHVKSISKERFTPIRKY
ncbi:ABC transporter permease subunit [Pontibacillus salicampi]|uniref:ABC transporter permease subunit n=1 Tax=Pontibacillus salicampi TaxID=1449801 RepID=A0ABV6LK75_9BACI